MNRSITALTTAGLLVGAAYAAPPPKAPPPHIEVSSARDCGGVLDVGYSIEVFEHHAWRFDQDKGNVRVQIHHIGNGAPVGGTWDDTRPSVRRSEGYLGVPIDGEPTWDSLRVAFPVPGWGDVASSPALVGGGCVP